MVGQTFLPNARRSTLHGPELLRPQAAKPRPLTARPTDFSLPPIAPSFSAASITQVDPDFLLRNISLAAAAPAVQSAPKVTFRDSLAAKVTGLKDRASAFFRRHPSLAYGAAALGFGAATLLPNTALAGGMTDSITGVLSGAMNNGLLTFGLTTLAAVALKTVYTRNIKRGASSARRLITRYFLPMAVVLNGAGLGMYLTSFLAQNYNLPGYFPSILLAGTAAVFTGLRMLGTGIAGLYNRRKAYMRAAYQQYGTSNKMLTEVVSRPAQLGLLYYFSYRHTEVAAVGLGIAAKFFYNLPALVASPFNILFGAALGLYLGHRRAADLGRSPLWTFGVTLAGGAVGAMAGALGGHLLANFFFTVSLMSLEDTGLSHGWQLNSGARKAEEHNPDDPTDREIHETSRSRHAESMVTVKCSNKAENIVSSLFVMLLCSPGTNDAYIQHNTTGYGDNNGMDGLDWLRDSVLVGMKGRITNAWRRAWPKQADGTPQPNQPSWQERVEILAALCEQMGTYLRDRQSRGDFGGSGVDPFKLGDAAFCGPNQPENRHFLGKIVKYYGNLLIRDAASLRSMAADGQFPLPKEVLGMTALKVLDTLYRKFNPPLQFSPTFNFKNLFPIPSMPDQKYHGTDMIWNLTGYFGTGTAVFRQKPVIVDLCALPPELAGQTALIDRYFARTKGNNDKALPRASMQTLNAQALNDPAAPYSTKEALTKLLDNEVIDLAALPTELAGETALVAQYYEPVASDPGKARRRADKGKLVKQVQDDMTISTVSLKTSLLAQIKKGFEEFPECIPLRIAKQLRPEFNSDELWNIESRQREDNRQGWAPQPICNIGPDHASDIFMVCADEQYHELVEAVRTEHDRGQKEAKIKALLAQFPTNDVVAAPQIPAGASRLVFFKNGSIRRIFGDGHSEVVTKAFDGSLPPDDISWLPGCEPNPELDFAAGNFRMLRTEGRPVIFCYLKTLLEQLSDEEQTGVKVADEKCAMTRDIGPRPDGPVKLEDEEDPDHNPVLLLQRNQTVRIKAPYNPAMKLHENDALVRIEEGQAWFVLKITRQDGTQHYVPLNVPKSDPEILGKGKDKNANWQEIDRDRAVTIRPNGRPGCYDVTATRKDGTSFRFPYPELLYYLDDLSPDGLSPFAGEAEIIFNEGVGPEALWEYSHVVRNGARQIVDKQGKQVTDRDGRVIDQQLWDLYSRRPKRVQDYQAMAEAERAPWPWVDEEGLVHLPDGSIFTPPDPEHQCSSYLYWLQQRNQLIEATTYVGFAHEPAGFGQHFEHGSVR